MGEFWNQVRENLLFVVCCGGIAAALVVLARIAEHFLPDTYCTLCRFPVMRRGPPPTIIG